MARIRAPELVGRGWVNAPRLGLADLRGRFALLDFWTFCCINCLHVLDELRPLERRWEDVLTVVGVHSPKFRHEADRDALLDAVVRYGVEHPVLDDADMVTWSAYAARAWPTLVLVDPEGYLLAQYAGEGHAHAIDALLAEHVPVAEGRGVLRRGPVAAADLRAVSTPLLFPDSVVATPDGRLLVSDTAHHQLVVLDAAGERELARVGTGRRGLLDGGPAQAAFSEPQGLCVLPDDVAADVGYDVVVSDSVNHALRGLNLGDLTVRTLAGTGRPWTPVDAEGTLSSPRGLAWWQGRVWVGMVGVHQLWTFDPRSGHAGPAAGTRTEGLRDGPLADAWFAQPSALAPDGDRLWLVDAETSALRWVQDGEVRTAVGTGLFDFGFRDGRSAWARLQHPLGVTALPDGSVAVSDTYNGALRRYDPSTGVLETMAVDLREPSDALLDGTHLLVVESAAHRLTRVPLGARAPAGDSAERSERPPTPLAPGEVDLVVAFVPPPGQSPDERYGPATRLSVTATPSALLADGAGAGTTLRRRLVLDPAVGSGVLHVAATAASCDSTASAACHLHQQDWGIPVTVEPDAPTRLDLALGGAAG